MLNVLATSITRTATSVSLTTSGSLLPHPALPIKCITIPSPQIRTACQRYCYSNGAYNKKAAASVERMSNNISRLYARRVLELASMSAATMAITTKMECQTEMISKPSEWSTVDLVAQRREFGESISSLGKTKIERIWAAGSRIVNLALLASPLALLIPLAYVAGPESKPADCAWEYATWSIEKAGPTFIKLVQWATTRNDLFPAEFITKFSKLQDDTLGHSWKETVKTLEEAFGKNYEDVLQFEDSSKNKSRRSSTRLRKDKILPIGSGCIAQVYKATLKQNAKLLPAGTEVAVKVTHPDILHKVCVDFYILNKITAIVEKIPHLNLDYLSMKDSVQQFRDIMLPQLDLRVEANNLRRFRRDFDGDARVAFPLPLSELTSKDVLIESFVHGEPILDLIKGKGSFKCSTEERQELAKIGLETVMKMIFMNDFVHGDLHPGNILVDRNNGVSGKPLRMNMIDCGLVVEMGENDHINLVKILGALIKRDGHLAGGLMVDTARKCQATALDVEIFCKGIQKICDDDEDNNFLESVGDYLADICYLACKHKVKLEASFINAALACEIMEGIASTLYPDMEVQRIALPMVVKAEMMHGLRGMKLL